MIVVAAAILALSITPGPPGVGAPGLDKVGHLAEFALLGALTSRASNARSRAMVALLVALGLGIATEAAQLATPDRAAELGDLAADLLGGLLGAAGWSLVRRRGQTGARSLFS